ncbi:tRNA isopentenyl-2-thiomethyl-A-37 hydroxylase MiaE [uncultured Porticoccus sp.]|uniref:tRNA-(ms[2]io[6]A)-hydroxylase n=1 Tax=uncultured Porticoccus sp. TaxID=1256050 RepID=UPI00262391BE|nr:tRNA isopentenyl-2-thiomethyl-A-37 hydroxylase MiaE [uncultured Porticoccus sp.]
MAVSALDEIQAFLPCPTPDSWVEEAVKLENQDVLLIDHANCEKKAASTALNLIYRYTDNFELLNKMSRLAREEMRHFEQVIAIMAKRNIEYSSLSASRYAAGLRQQVRTHEPAKLLDTLIVGAFIEARSCERFACLAPYLDSELQTFYRSLLQSEGRHYRDYLTLARRVGKAGEVEKRVEVIRRCEQQLVTSPDTTFRFHSGAPVTSTGVTAVVESVEIPA